MREDGGVLVRSKAGFKALMEECGFGRRELAGWLGVDVKTVARWLSPVYAQVAPAGVWERLAGVLGEREELVRGLVDQVGDESTVRVSYARRAQDLPDDVAVPVGVFNANARAVGVTLLARGHLVDYVYLPPQGGSGKGRPAVLGGSASAKGKGVSRVEDR